MAEYSYKFGALSLEDSGRVLLRAGQPVAATPKVLALLYVLVASANRLVSKEELLRNVWPDSYVDEANLTQTISVLRKLLVPDFPNESPIETVPRVGYRFRAEVRTVERDQDSQPVVLNSLPISNASPADLVAKPAFDPEPLYPPQRFPALGRKRLWLSAAVVFAVAVSVATVLTVNRGHNSRPKSVTGVRIAILPLQDESVSKDTQWISDGVREIFNADLSTGDAVEATPLETVNRAVREVTLNPATRNDAPAVRGICNELGCDVLVTGSYKTYGNGLEFTGRILDGASGYLLKEVSYRGTQDVFNLEQALATGTRSRLGLKGPTSRSLTALRSSIPSDSAAFRLYVEGLQKKQGFDGRAAADYFRQAIAIAPRFAMAHRELSGALIILGHEAEAVSEAQRAQSLSQTLSQEEQLKSAAALHIAEHRFDAAAAAYHDLLTLHPMNESYRRLFAAELSYAGRPQEAVNQLRPLLVQNGNSKPDPATYSVLSDCYSLMGDWPSALDAAQHGAAESRIRGAQVIYGRLLTSESQARLNLGQLPLALELTQQALEIARRFGDTSGELRALNRLGQVYTAMGRYAEARAPLEQALALEERVGELEREIHTLAALGLNLQKQHAEEEATVIFRRELVLANEYGLPLFIAQAELNLAGQEMRAGKTTLGRRHLQSIAEKAALLNNRNLAEDVAAELKKHAH